MQVCLARITQKSHASIFSENFIEQLKSAGIHSDNHIALYEKMLNIGLITRDKSLPKMDKDLRKAYPDIGNSTRKAIGLMIMSPRRDDLFRLF